MVMNYENSNLKFSHEKYARVRFSWVPSAGGSSRIFQMDFKVFSSSAAEESMSLETFVTKLNTDVLDKFATIQSTSFRWIRCTIQPDVGDTVLHPVVLEPKFGRLATSEPKGKEFIINLILAGASQSRNLVLPGVSEELSLKFASYSNALKDIETLFAKGLEFESSTKAKLTFSYARLAPNDKPSTVLGASAIGFRTKSK